VPSVTVYRPTADAEVLTPVAVAPKPTPPPEYTREHLIEIAWKNGSLKMLVARLQYEAECEGRTLHDDTALARAKEIVANFGVTSPQNMPHEVTAAPPRWKHAKLVLGPNPYGRKVSTGVETPVGSHVSGDGSRSKREEKRAANVAREAAKRVSELRAERRAKHTLEELRATDTGNSDRQRQAHVLVRLQGLSMAEAGRRMKPPVHRQTVADLLKKFDRSST
jgi:hypothetical protein